MNVYHKFSKGRTMAIGKSPSGGSWKPHILIVEPLEKIRKFKKWH